MTAGRLTADGRFPSDAAAGRRLLPDRGDDPLHGMLPVAGRALAAAAAIGGITLLARRLGGGFALPPSPLLTFGVAAAGLGLVTATDRLVAATEWPARLLARGGLLAAAAAALPPGGGTATLAGLTALVGAAIAAAGPLLPVVRELPGMRLRVLRRPFRPVPPVAAEPAGPVAPPLPDSPSVPTAAAEPMAGIRQRLERFEDAAGHDCLRGSLLLPVAAGSRSGHAHVGFCPPFAATPAVAVSTDCDFVEADLAAAEILPWGVRVECRLSEPAEEPLEIPVAILVSSVSAPVL